MKKQRFYYQQGGALKRWLYLVSVLVIAIAVIMFFWEGESRRSISDLASSVQPLAAADAPSQAAIPQTDLPPPGSRSLFDHLIANHDGLPYPFTDLLAVIQQQRPGTMAADVAMTEGLLIPDGRSLLKAHANFNKPRVIVAAADNAANSTAALGPMLKGRLFLGFVEDANEIEVISYNEVAGRFEYQLVKDYCEGCVPKIVYAKRALCTTCHMNQAAIFSQRPWQETNAQASISAEIMASRGVDEPYQGTALTSSLQIADSIDNLTEISNTIVTTQRLWIDGCGDNRACRTRLLKLALQFAVEPGLFNPNAPEAAELKTLQAQQWPADGIVHASADLVSRDPFSAKAHGGGIRGLVNSFFGQDVLNDQPDTNDLSAFEKLPPLPAELDPLTPRPAKAIYTAEVLDGVYGVAQLFSTADIALLRSAGNINAIQRAVDHPAVQTELTAKPAQRSVLLNALLQALDQPVMATPYTDTTVLSAPLLDGEPPLQLSADSPLLPFEKYCFACHRGNPAARLNFMSGASEAEVLEQIKATDNIRDVLDYERYLNSDKSSTLMPPATSWQRAQLDAAIAAGEAPHEAMRDEVPSLFDF